jgi:hypothetical protein
MREIGLKCRLSKLAFEGDLIAAFVDAPRG